MANLHPTLRALLDTAKRTPAGTDPGQHGYGVDVVLRIRVYPNYAFIYDERDPSRTNFSPLVNRGQAEQILPYLVDTMRDEVIIR